MCVYPPKSCVTWSRTPTLWIEARIIVNKGWKSVKLIYKQKAVKLLKWGNFLYETWNHRNKITSLFYPKIGVVSHVWTKRPPIGLKYPPLGILSRHIDKKSKWYFWLLEFYLHSNWTCIRHNAIPGSALAAKWGRHSRGASRRQGPDTQARLVINWST